MKSERGSGAASFAGSVLKRAGWLSGLGCIVTLVLAAGLGLLRVYAQQASFSLPAIDPPKTAAKAAPEANQQNQQQAAEGQPQASYSLPAIDPPRTAAKPAGISDLQNKEQDANDKQQAAATAPGQGGVTGECADLLKMATDLKTAVDKTNQDTLSVTVVRKADEIEQLAKKVRLGSGKS
jgi:hypothetical protein